MTDPHTLLTGLAIGESPRGASGSARSRPDRQPLPPGVPPDPLKFMDAADTRWERGAVVRCRPNWGVSRRLTPSPGNEHHARLG
jgi:hypothetical protein